MDRFIPYQITLSDQTKSVPVNTPLGFNFPSYQDDLLKKYFNLTPDLRILDVGEGSNIFKYANVRVNVISEPFSYQQQEAGTPLTLVTGLDYVESEITSLPFKDKEFDFVICRHVLEHIDDPILACKELSRVAKRGFIEVSSRVNEYLHGYPSHLWLCDFHDGFLTFEPKPFVRNPFKNMTRKLYFTDPEFQMNFEYLNRNIFCTQVYWEDKINVRVLEKKQEFQYFNYKDPLQAAAAHLDFALNYMSFLLPQLEEEIETHLKYAEKFIPENSCIKEVRELFANRKKISVEEYVKLIKGMQDKDLLNQINAAMPQKDSVIESNDHVIKKLFRHNRNYPYVSIIIRTYNREDLLNRCLKSVEEQYYPNIEVIVVNDGGRDISHLLENRKYKCHCIRHGNNLGKAAALNSGLRMARGKYINILDDDDIIYPEHISLLVTLLENSDYRVAYTNSMINIENKIHGRWETVKKAVQYSQPHHTQFLLRTNYLPILTVMFERELLTECGYVNEDYDVLEDWDLWIRFALVTDFYHIKQITAEYCQRIIGDNATQNLSGTFSTIRNSIFQTYMHHYRQRDEALQYLKPLQEFDKRFASFLYIPDSFEECIKAIKYFTENFQHTEWIGLYILPTFSDDEINQLHLDFKLENSQFIRFLNMELKDHLEGFIYHFDFIIESHHYQEIKKEAKRLYHERIVSLSDIKSSLSNHPLFGPLYNYDKNVPLVSIIVLTKNQLDYTKLCVESIYQFTRNPFELIIVDNGSNEDTVMYLKKLLEEKKNVKVIFNETNLGYGAGNNQGLTQASGEYIVFLNNDVIVTEDWVSKMIDAVESNPKYGICGPVSNHVAGIQKIIDPLYDVDFLEIYAKKHTNKYKSQYQPADRVIGFCMLVKREVIEQIGGFDLNFGIGNFEDDDFCIRARLANFYCVIAKEVFIHHFGSITFKNEIPIKYEAIFTENLLKFYHKWGIPIPADGVIHGYDVNQIKKTFNKLEHYCPLIENNS